MNILWMNLSSLALSDKEVDNAALKYFFFFFEGRQKHCSTIVCQHPGPDV